MEPTQEPEPSAKDPISRLAGVAALALAVMFAVAPNLLDRQHRFGREAYLGMAAGFLVLGITLVLGWVTMRDGVLSRSGRTTWKGFAVTVAALGAGVLTYLVARA